MINPFELQIGNLIRYDNKILSTVKEMTELSCTVKFIKPNDIGSGDRIGWSKIYPVRIDFAILRIMGFSHIAGYEGNKFWHPGVSPLKISKRFEITGDVWTVESTDHSVCIVKTEIEYAHQLQNLYHILFNKQLALAQA